MTTRERHLAVTLVAVLGTGLVGFVSYQFVLSPLLEMGRQIEAKKTEIGQLEAEIFDIQLQKRKFEAARQQSLPADVGRSREQYGNLLEKLCHRADLTELKIQQSEPDSKSVPMLAPRKPAYTKLTYKVTAKGEVYHLVDFLRLFYQQPLLHTIKAMNIQRPSEARARERRELDIDLTVEALVLDRAPDRGTLLPIVREVALLTGAAAQAGFNTQAVASGKGAAVGPTGLLSESVREYLAIASKDVFFGPRRERPEPDTTEEDLSKYIFLTSIAGYEDGTIKAVFRDKSTNNDYVITQSPQGAIAVVGEYELTPGRRKVLPGYSETRPGQILLYGSSETANLRAWRVRRVTLGEVILEKLDAPGSDEKPKPPGLAFVGGGPGAVVAVPEGKVYSVPLGHCLDSESRLDATPPGMPPPSRLLTREAWRAIYTPAPPPAPPVSTVSTEERGGR